jgi:hypothetical protein
VLTADVAQREATRLLDEGRQHKRLAAFHRRQAQQRMRALDELRRTCRRLGISLVIEAPGGTDEQRSDHHRA